MLPIIECDCVEINGTRLYYEMAGESEIPLVLVHAGIADCRMWDGQFAALAQEMRVLRYDMRGYGQSFPATGEFSHAADLLGLLDHLSIPRAVLVGCSKGGSAALDLALAHPLRAAGLGLVCSAPPGFPFEGEPPRQWEEMTAAFRRRDFWRAAELDVEIWVDGPHRTPDQVNASVRELVRVMDMTALANEANGLGSETWLNAQAATCVEELRLPTLVVIGELDDPNIIRAGNWLAKTIPNAQCTRFPQAAHLPNMEQPEEFNRMLRKFIRGIPEK